MKGNDVVLALMRKFGVNTITELAVKIGLSQQAIKNWKNRERITSRQIAGLVHSATRAAAREGNFGDALLIFTFSSRGEAWGQIFILDKYPSHRRAKVGMTVRK